jgi:hypothetical protein
MNDTFGGQKVDSVIHKEVDHGKEAKDGVRQAVPCGYFDHELSRVRLPLEHQRELHIVGTITVSGGGKKKKEVAKC